MNYKELAKDFPAHEWEWRVDSSGTKGNGEPWCRVVPYIQNRAIQNRLDEVCGPENWHNEFKEWKLKGQLCGISIFNAALGEWVTKWDGADDTDFQSTKGGLSSSMKRAAVQWGIGRHLYELDAVYVECSLEHKYGWEQTKTKDKTVVYWNPKDKKLCGAPVVRGADENGDGEKTKAALDITALIEEYTKKVRKLEGDDGTDVQAYFLKAHRRNIYDVTANALRQAIASIDDKIAKASVL
jgi:hypothetical protein